MVTRDTLPPFDKPKLSKVRRATYTHPVELTSLVLNDFSEVRYLKGRCFIQALSLDSSSILLRPADFYQQYGIEVWTQKEVRGTKETLSH